MVSCYIVLIAFQGAKECGKEKVAKGSAEVAVNYSGRGKGKMQNNIGNQSSERNIILITFGHKIDLAQTTTAFPYVMIYYSVEE